MQKAPNTLGRIHSPTRHTEGRGGPTEDVVQETSRLCCAPTKEDSPQVPHFSPFLLSHLPALLMTSVMIKGGVKATTCKPMYPNKGSLGVPHPDLVALTMDATDLGGQPGGGSMFL